MDDAILTQLQALADGVEGSEGAITITRVQHDYLTSNKARLKSAEATSTQGYRIACGELCEVVEHLKARPVRADKRRTREPEAPPAE